MLLFYARVLYLEVSIIPSLRHLYIRLFRRYAHAHAVDSPPSDTADVDSVLVLMEDKLTQLILASMTPDG